jgi:ribosomal-protein-alanine N-acetyltransferase
VTGLVLEAARPADVEALLALERLCYTHPWTRQHFTDVLADPARGRLFVLRAPLAGKDALRAYCAVAWAADEVQVHNLAVHPGARRQGIGRWLLERALDFGRRQGARTAFLEVRASNEPAVRMYGACGFRQVQLRRRYYQAPVEDAIVLRKELR